MDLIEKNEANNFVHPWEISRAASIINVLKLDSENLYFADIGAGDMYFTKQLLDLTNQPIYAVDTGYTISNKGQTIIQLTHIDELPVKSMDVIFLMDVLEHVEDEDGFLKRVTDRLKDDGRLVITVPALQCLFSAHDEYLKHFRRYNRPKLRLLLKKHNVVIDHIFYFYSILAVARFLEIIRNKIALKQPDMSGVGNWKYSQRHLLTRMINGILSLDFAMHLLFSKIHIQIAGLSLCAVCRIKSS